MVTAVFADLVDYVRMIAEHDPEVVRARVGAALRRMGEAIERLEGTREKFIGDAVFAVFGWPIAHDDDPVRASLAALAIRAMLREPDDGSEPLEVRIGIATGEVVAASRDDRSGDLAVTGEAITTAARIQSLARPGEILLDEATVRGARDRLARGRPRLGRAARPILGRCGCTRSPGSTAWTTTRRRGPGADGPLVGRAAEMAVIRKTLRRARRSGRGAVVLVSGDAGMGKSRLVAEVEPERGRWATRGPGPSASPTAAASRIGSPGSSRRPSRTSTASTPAATSGSCCWGRTTDPATIRRYGGAIAAVARDAAFTGWEAEAADVPDDPAETAPPSATSPRPTSTGS